MPRAATGRIEVHEWADGETVSWLLRVRAKGKRHTIKLGTNHEGMSDQLAEVERDKVVEQIARGTWRPQRPQAKSSKAEDDETIHETLSRWWEDKRGEVGEGTAADYERRLELLLTFDPDALTAEIDARWVNDLRAHLAKRKKANGMAGTLSPRSVNMALTVLAAALDLAVDDGLLPANPARGRRRRMKQTKPARTFLEADMVFALLEAAGGWEAKLPEHQRYGRRPFLALLCLAGPRIGEAIAADRGDFDLKAGRWHIPASKTDAGKRDVELSDYLRAELQTHAAEMKRLGRATGARDPMFPTATGGRLNGSNIRTRLLARTIEMADERRGDSRRIPDGITPHSLRRTYASLALAHGDDPRFVMGQLGHTDARFTLSVYAQILQRKRVDKRLLAQLMSFGNDPRNDPMEQKRANAEKAPKRKRQQKTPR